MVVLLFMTSLQIYGQVDTARHTALRGKFIANGIPVPSITVTLEGKRGGTITNEEGLFNIKNLPVGRLKLHFSGVGYAHFVKEIQVENGENILADIELKSTSNSMEDVVVTGTLKEVRRMESPVPVEVYTPVFFRKNPTPNATRGAFLLKNVASPPRIIIPTVANSVLTGCNKSREMGMSSRYSPICVTSGSMICRK